MKLSELFDITYGNRKYHNKTSLITGNIPLASSKGTDNGIYGKFAIEQKYKQCITCPCTGSTCKASYHNYPMDSDDNTLVLVPKKEMSDLELCYYTALIISLKFKYFYGRQVTPVRLNNTNIPDTISDWVYKIDLSKYDRKPLDIKDKNKTIIPTASKLFKITDLFTISKVKGPSLREAKDNPGDIPFITATEQNNGVSAYTSIKAEHKGNCLTIAGNGSIGATFYQPIDFCGTSDINVLIPKFELTETRAMYLIPIFEAHKFKYNYGRKWNLERMNNTTIMLPAKDDQVDWGYIDNIVQGY